MKVRIATLLFFSTCAVAAQADAIPLDLGAASSFAVLSGSAITNTGSTTVYGDLGVWPGSSVSGFLPGVVTGGSTYAGDATAMLAEAGLTAAYTAAASSSCATTLTGRDLGNLTLTPGTYCFASSAQLTGVLTLDAEGDPNAEFLFQIGSSLTTASGSSVVFSGGGTGKDVFWQVGSSATLGTTTSFAGSILALDSISLDTGATIGCGRALAQTGAVSLEGNVVSIGASACGNSDPAPVGDPGGLTAVPEPGSLAMLGTGLLGIVGYGRRRLDRAA